MFIAEHEQDFKEKKYNVTRLRGATDVHNTDQVGLKITWTSRMYFHLDYQLGSEAFQKGELQK